MASPQLEDGFTRIANELLEQLMLMHLSPNQWQVLLCIIRKTYGFTKKSDYIANSQIVEATGLCKAVISRSLKTLTLMGMVERKGKFIGIQKDWEKWQKLAVSSTLGVKLAEQSTVEKLAIQSTKLAEQSTKVSSPRITQKKKEIIQKKVYGEFQNVFLTDNELAKLQQRFPGGDAEKKIENLSSAIESRGYKYKRHYATILNWAQRDNLHGSIKKDGGNNDHGTLAEW